MSEKNQSESNTKVLRIDVSDALKGLKAINRESKKVIETLKHLNEVQNND